MTVKEVENAFQELRNQGWDDQEIVGVLFAMFNDDKIDDHELETLCSVLGFEIEEEWKNLSIEEKKASLRI